MFLWRVFLSLRGNFLLFTQHERRMILNSVWAQKYEELVIENAELHVKLQHLDSQMSSDFRCAHHSVRTDFYDWLEHIAFGPYFEPMIILLSMG